MTVSDGLCLKIQFFRSVGFKDRLEKGEGRSVVGGGGRGGRERTLWVGLEKGGRKEWRKGNGLGFERDAFLRRNREN